MSRPALALALVLATAPAAAAGGNLAVRGGLVHTMAGPPIRHGTVLIQAGLITAVGHMDTVAIPDGTPVIEAAGAEVHPGLIDAGTPLGLVEIDAVKATVDRQEGGDPILPQMLVADAFHAESELIPVARANGITYTLVVPGPGSLVAGRSAMVRLHGATGRDMIVASPVAVHAYLGEAAIKPWRDEKKAPWTRMGAAAMLRQTLIRAGEHKAAIERYRAKTARIAENEDAEHDDEPKKEPEPPKSDLKLEALFPVIEGKMPLIVGARRRDDILTALRIGEEFNARIIIAFGAEAWMVADRLAKAKVPVIIGPVREVPGSMETKGATYENAAILHKAGVEIAFLTGWAHDLRNLPYHAAVATAYGLPRDATLHALTLGAARILGVDDQIGSLEVGKEGSLRIVEGDPLEITSKVRNVVIRGVDLPLESRHTRLRDRYR